MPSPGGFGNPPYGVVFEPASAGVVRSPAVYRRRVAHVARLVVFPPGVNARAGRGAG